MAQQNLPEVWLRGAVPGVEPLLQPVAHALLQAREEVNAMMEGFDETKLWNKPGGTASVGFHLQHLAGVIDRLFTYARGESLTEAQLNMLALEKKSPRPERTVQEMLQKFNDQVDKAMEQLRKTGESALLERRGVGRAQLPSNTLGLLFHAAEHTMRHVGQLLVTVRVC